MAIPWAHQPLWRLHLIDNMNDILVSDHERGATWRLQTRRKQSARPEVWRGEITPKADVFIQVGAWPDFMCLTGRCLQLWVCAL